MIAYIKGQLELIGQDYVIVDHDGIGYQIFVPASVLGQMPARGTEIKYIRICMSVRIICVFMVF